eukprot:15121599-Heterocapsa_arctica.AAC.1
MVDMDGPTSEEEREGSEAWKEVRRVLRGLGYCMEKADGWGMLGITKYEGADPDKMIIRRRAGLLNDQLGTVIGANLEQQEQAE